MGLSGEEKSWKTNTCPETSSVALSTCDLCVCVCVCVCVCEREREKVSVYISVICGLLHTKRREKTYATDSQIIEETKTKKKRKMF